LVGIPIPPPDIKPEGGMERKQKAIPSAAVPSKIRNSNSAIHLVQRLRSNGWS